MDPKFSIEFQVNSHDADINGNVRPSIVLRYFHEAANLQFESGHPTLDELRYDMKKAFLLSRASFSLTRQLRAFEKITVDTWSGGGKAATFYRCGEIKVGEETVGSLVSVWALLDLETGRLCRYKDADIGIAALEEYPIAIPTHFAFPAHMTLAEVGKRKVMNSDIDVNRHMNNTNYPDMLCNFIPDIDKMAVKAFEIRYIHEAKYGDELTVYHGFDGTYHYLRSFCSDGSPNAEAKVLAEVVA